jgi:CRP-like cAMP-binding protein
VDYFVKNFPDQVSVGGGVPSDVAAAAAAMGIAAPAADDVETDSEDDEDDDWVDELPAYTPVETVAGGGGRRRTAVSAASTNPDELKAQFEAQKKTHDKTPAEIERLTELLKENMLFGHLDATQTGTLIDAFFPREHASGDEIITEGADGDLFYILDTGTATVFKNVDGERKQVFEYEPGASFGELALMYNAPRAATIVASSACKVFCLDRLTFKVVLMESTKEKRGLYEGFLSGVDLLGSLNAYERSTIADALSEVTFTAGDTIITQGREFVARGIPSLPPSLPLPLSSSRPPNPARSPHLLLIRSLSLSLTHSLALPLAHSRAARRRAGQRVLYLEERLRVVLQGRPRGQGARDWPGWLLR